MLQLFTLLGKTLVFYSSCSIVEIHLIVYLYIINILLLFHRYFIANLFVFEGIGSF